MIFSSFNFSNHPLLEEERLFIDAIRDLNRQSHQLSADYGGDASGLHAEALVKSTKFLQGVTGHVDNMSHDDGSDNSSLQLDSKLFPNCEPRNNNMTFKAPVVQEVSSIINKVDIYVAPPVETIVSTWLTRKDSNESEIANRGKRKLDVHSTDLNSKIQVLDR